jgi:DNA-binding XRE family transcriptional regulator
MQSRSLSLGISHITHHVSLLALSGSAPRGLAAAGSPQLGRPTLPDGTRPAAVAIRYRESIWHPLYYVNAILHIFSRKVEFLYLIVYTHNEGGSMVTRKEIGERVRQRRRLLDLTQKALAEQCGCSYQVINGLERGRQSVYAERLAAIAVALRVTSDYLLGLSAMPRAGDSESEYITAVA